MTGEHDRNIDVIDLCSKSRSPFFQAINNGAVEQRLAIILHQLDRDDPPGWSIELEQNNSACFEMACPARVLWHRRANELNAFFARVGVRDRRRGRPRQGATKGNADNPFPTA
ncbi:MAG: hypothetical protein ABR514_08695 [Chthoniobacterales bacterium]